MTETKRTAVGLTRQRHPKDRRSQFTKHRTRSLRVEYPTKYLSEAKVLILSHHLLTELADSDYDYSHHIFHSCKSYLSSITVGCFQVYLLFPFPRNREQSISNVSFYQSLSKSISPLDNTQIVRI